MIARYRQASRLPAWIACLTTAVAFGASLPRNSAAQDAASRGDGAADSTVNAAAAPLSTFEGVLHVHPKFLYRYYIVGQAEGQHFALFGDDKLKEIPLGSAVEVVGRLGTRFHPGGTAENPSPFPRAWFVYMDVQRVKVLRPPEPKSDPTTPAPVSVRPGTPPRPK